MALFAMGDLHLSLSGAKPMDIFGGWENHSERILDNWEKTVSDNDTVVIPGDISWGMNMDEALEDFRFIHRLKGTKIISKGNHDYWWSTAAKMYGFFEKNGLDSIKILHNNHYRYGSAGICGTRGWINDGSEPANVRILAREAGRLEMSISSAEKEGLEPIVFLHYPPLFGTEYNYDILDVLYRHNVKKCFYGHVHGKGHRYAVNGERDGIMFRLVSSDYLQFKPLEIL